MTTLLPHPLVAPSSPTPMGQLVGEGGGGVRSFSSASYQLGTGIIRNSMAISIGQTPLVVQLASHVGWVKFPNWLILFTNVSPGSLKVSTGHIAVHTHYASS